MQLEYIKGIGEKRVKQFKKLEVQTLDELAQFFPRNYVDLTKTQELSFALNGRMCFVKAVAVNAPQSMSSKRNVSYIKLNCVTQHSNYLTCLWFNSPYVKAKLIANEEYLFYGRLNCDGEKFSIVNPMFEKANECKVLKGMMPIYSLTKGMEQYEARSAVKQALKFFKPSSVIPPQVEKQFGLMSLQRAYELIHAPNDYRDIENSRSRIAIEEILLVAYAFKFTQSTQKLLRNIPYSNGDSNITSFINSLPFELTNSQSDAVDKLLNGFKSVEHINALLQGDVGSGKTIVALIAMYYTYLNGKQSALMAPTEVLAKQHYELCEKFFAPLGVNVCYMAGGLAAGQKRDNIESIKNGKANFVIGTHSIIMNDLQFANLGLAITDEQHRFSVNQRKALTQFCDGVDVLVLSATPIPRTLALVLYGDMDIITMAQKPSNRLSIKTSIIPKTKYDGMYKFIKEQFTAGNQAFFVCPKIEADEDSSALSVEEQFEYLKNQVFKDYRVEMLHGAMANAKKQSVMKSFAEKQFDCLVCTTVIEVGVDIRDATVMVIYDADRFGLTQLHQLRGRVGRSDKQSYCFLTTQTQNEISQKRLKVFCSSNDGFELANQDFNMRGFGDLTGEVQHGFINPVFKRLTFDCRTLDKCNSIKKTLNEELNYRIYFMQYAPEKYKNQITITL